MNIVSRIESTEVALDLLDNASEEPAFREAAVHYLRDHASPQALERLVWALQDDDFGVRWEAALALTQMGQPALVEVLKAIADPRRVGDPRLREGVYHILHNSLLPAPLDVTDLLEALRGPAADIASLVEAYHLLAQIDHIQLVESVRSRLHPIENPGLPLDVFRLQYGPAQLTGRLSRLGIHHNR